MTRKSVTLPKDINTIIKEFYEVDTKVKALNKIVSEDKEFIKDYFIKNNLDVLEVDGIKCSVNVTNRETFNEEQCMAILQNMLNTQEITQELYDNVVKLKPYIDEDYLEKAIYTKQISAESLNDCIESKSVCTCRISRIKKEEN